MNLAAPATLANLMSLATPDPAVSFTAILVLGFFLGMRHATDPDHVIAVTTIVARERTVKLAAWIGALWGLGHTITIFAVGSGIILLGWVIPPHVGLTMEFSVGLMLILLGVLNLTGMMQWITNSLMPAHTHPIDDFADPHAHDHAHSHVHMHGDYIHTHTHSHDPELHTHAFEATPLARMDRLFGKLGAYQILRPLIIGLVHGLAGSAAVALLVLATIRDAGWGVLYLLIFGVGTIAGMMLITAAIAIPFSYTVNRFEAVNRLLRISSGIISLAFGLFIAYKIGYVDGLFSAHPHWTPE